MQRSRTKPIFSKSGAPSAWGVTYVDLSNNIANEEIISRRAQASNGPPRRVAAKKRFGADGKPENIEAKLDLSFAAQHAAPLTRNVRPPKDTSALESCLRAATGDIISSGSPVLKWP